MLGHLKVWGRSMWKQCGDGIKAIENKWRLVYSVLPFPMLRGGAYIALRFNTRFYLWKQLDCILKVSHGIRLWIQTSCFLFLGDSHTIHYKNLAIHRGLLEYRLCPGKAPSLFQTLNINFQTITIKIDWLQ